MLAANGISFFPYPSRYAVRYEGDSPYTAMFFISLVRERRSAAKMTKKYGKANQKSFFGRVALYAAIAL